MNTPQLTTTASIERYHAPSGNRDNDKFRGTCAVCPWTGTVWHSNRTVEGRQMAQRDAEDHATTHKMVECRECKGLGVIPAGIDREAGRDPGRDCWKCGGYGEHIR